MLKGEPVIRQAFEAWAYGQGADSCLRPSFRRDMRDPLLPPGSSGLSRTDETYTQPSDFLSQVPVLCSHRVSTPFKYNPPSVIFAILL